LINFHPASQSLLSRNRSKTPETIQIGSGSPPKIGMVGSGYAIPVVEETLVIAPKKTEKDGLSFTAFKNKIGQLVTSKEEVANITPNLGKFANFIKGSFIEKKPTLEKSSSESFFKIEFRKITSWKWRRCVDWINKNGIWCCNGI